MKKYVFALLIVGCFFAFLFSFREDATASVEGLEISEATVNKSSEGSSVVDNKPLGGYSSESSVLVTSSSYVSSEPLAISVASMPWDPFSPSQEIQNKIDGVIGGFSTPVVRAFIKVDPDFLEQIEVDGIYDIPIPDAADADMHVVNIEKKDGLISVVGHLSGYPESYYIGFSYDKEGHIYGEITTEKSNYSIKTYYGQPVVIKVVPEMEKTQRDDF